MISTNEWLATIPRESPVVRAARTMYTYLEWARRLLSDGHTKSEFYFPSQKNVTLLILYESYSMTNWVSDSVPSRYCRQYWIAPDE